MIRFDAEVLIALASGRSADVSEMLSLANGVVHSMQIND
jgi:hypothetical protein